LVNFKSHFDLDVTTATKSEQNTLSPNVCYRLSFSNILNISFRVTGVSFYQGYSNCTTNKIKIKNQLQVVVIEGRGAGWITSCGFAHISKTSVALTMVPKEIALYKDGWAVKLPVQSLKASLINEPLFDINALRMRS